MLTDMEVRNLTAFPDLTCTTFRRGGMTSNLAVSPLPTRCRRNTHTSHSTSTVPPTHFATPIPPECILPILFIELVWWDSAILVTQAYAIDRKLYTFEYLYHTFIGFRNDAVNNGHINHEIRFINWISICRERWKRNSGWWWVRE